MKEETRKCKVCGRDLPESEFRNGKTTRRTCRSCYSKIKSEKYYEQKNAAGMQDALVRMIEATPVTEPEPDPALKEPDIIEANRNKAQRYLREAKGAFHDALDVLGRDNNTDAFLRHISERNAALWRWKHTQGEKPTTTDTWI